jgi:prepilin-type N-terminal cleavage/methylation domain-containing protein
MHPMRSVACIHLAQRQPPRQGRRGFTIIEMAVVVGIIAALLALSLPVITSSRRDARIAATRSVVLSVSAMIANDARRVWTMVGSGGALTVGRMWDLNQDGILDGRPSLENPLQPYPAGAENSGYTGLVQMLAPDLPKSHVDNAQRVIDAWGRPLRIAYHDSQYGARGYGVWSVGEDGQDDPLAARVDDIRSWEAAEAAE